MIVDKDENRYYIDKNGKIWTSGKPEFEYKLVSIDGLEYYVNQGIELIKSHNKIEGLLLLKSILALPVTNNTVYNAQMKASKQINELIKIDGPRYNKLNEDASLLLIKDNKNKIIINDFMFYSLKTSSNFRILSKSIRKKHNYFYYGILLGFSFKNDEIIQPNSGFLSYDLLLAIDAERFPNTIKNAKSVEEHWRKRLGSDTFKRDILNYSMDKIIYYYADNYQPNYSGFEGFYSKKNNGYYIKAITSRELFNQYKKEINELINNFQIK